MDAVTLLAVVCMIVVSGAFVWDRFAQRKRDSAVRTAEVAEWRTYAQHGHQIGNPTAPVTIVEFGDYECVACRFFHKSLAAVEKEFGDSVLIVYRHFPLENHPLGQTAARAAECAADQGKFLAYHKLLYENNSWLGLGSRALESYAKEVGVGDFPRFESCLFASSSVPTIDRDVDAAKELGAEGTPTLLINDQLIHGVLDSISLADRVRRAMSRADR